MPRTNGPGNGSCRWCNGSRRPAQGCRCTWCRQWSVMSTTSRPWIGSATCSPHAEPSPSSSAEAPHRPSSGVERGLCDSAGHAVLPQHGVPIGDLGVAAQQRAALPLGHAAPDPPLDAVVECFGQAFPAHRAAGTEQPSTLLLGPLTEQDVFGSSALGEGRPMLDMHCAHGSSSWTGPSAQMVGTRVVRAADMVRKGVGNGKIPACAASGTVCRGVGAACPQRRHQPPRLWTPSCRSTQLMRTRTLGSMPVTPKRVGGVFYSAIMFVAVSVLCGLLVAGLALPFAGMAGLASKSAVEELEELPVDLEIPPQAERTTVLLGNGKVLTHFYDENRVYVPLDKIAPAMQQAQIAIEDHRFYEHGAMDPLATVRAFLSNSAGGETAGASSLTQQYVKMVRIERASLNNDPKGVKEAQEQSYARKIQELRYAIALEKKLSKDEILERYLNIAYYGQ